MIDLRRPRNAVGATLLVGTAAIAVIVATSGARSAAFRPPLYVAISTTAALAGLAAAYLVFFRFRRSARLDDLLLGGRAGSPLGLQHRLRRAPGGARALPGSSRHLGLASGQVLGAGMIAFAAFAPAITLENPKRAAWRLVALFAHCARNARRGAHGLGECAVDRRGDRSWRRHRARCPAHAHRRLRGGRPRLPPPRRARRRRVHDLARRRGDPPRVRGNRLRVSPVARDGLGVHGRHLPDALLLRAARRRGRRGDALLAGVPPGGRARRAPAHRARSPRRARAGARVHRPPYQARASGRFHARPTSRRSQMQPNVRSTSRAA